MKNNYCKNKKFLRSLLLFYGKILSDANVQSNLGTNSLLGMTSQPNNSTQFQGFFSTYK